MNIAEEGTQGPAPMPELRCTVCPWSGEPAALYSCPSCESVVEVGYGPLPVAEPGEGQGVWRHAHVLPVTSEEARVTLHEGGTPLLPSEKLRRSSELFLKNETVNPTGSFKDRPVAVAISMARQLGLFGALCASTGNTAASVAAYAARAGIPCVCLAPETAPEEKLAQIRVVGARAVRMRGTYSDAHGSAEAICVQAPWANLTSTYVNPYMLEGDKTIAYEIFEQLGDRFPDWVVVPVGAGPLLMGIHKGFTEIRTELGENSISPRMAAVQAAGCSPIVRAFEDQASSVRAWDLPVATRASSIADPLLGYEHHGARTLEAIRASRGVAVAVSDQEIGHALSELAHQEGVFVEPGAAAALAGYRKLELHGLIGPRDRVVLVLTGHGLKDLQATMAIAPSAGVREDFGPVAPENLQALHRILEEMAYA